MGPIAEYQAFELRAAAADEARRSSRRADAFAEPGNDYLARTLRPLAEAGAFLRRSQTSHCTNSPDLPPSNIAVPRDKGKGNGPLEFPTTW